MFITNLSSFIISPIFSVELEEEVVGPVEIVLLELGLAEKVFGLDFSITLVEAV